MNPKLNNIGMVICEGAYEPSPINIIAESTIKGGPNRVVAECTLQDVDKENRNRRIYEEKDLFPQLTAKRTVELLKSGNLKGEAGHPMDKDLARQQTIDPNNTVARFLKFWMDGNNVMAQFKGTNNAKGEEFDQDLREGVLPSWSLRALGGLENVHGRNVVQNLRVITWDRVIYPSHPHAYTTRLVTENADILKKKDQSVINGTIIPITNDSMISYIKSESANIKSLINQIDFMYESVKLINNNKVQMVAKNGDIFVVNLESHIRNEIQSYCVKNNTK